MGSGFKTFTAGSVLTASDTQNYLMEQTNMVFASTAARDAAITSPEAGMEAITTDTNTKWIYSGSTWVQFGALGVWTSWTPVVYQNGARTSTNTASRYVQIGRVVHGWMNVTITNAGTLANDIAVSAPVTAATNVGPVGTWTYSRPATFLYVGILLWNGSTFSLQRDGAPLGSSPTSIATANGDVVRASFTYEAA